MKIDDDYYFQHECPHVEDLANLSKYIVNKNAKITVKQEPIEKKSEVKEIPTIPSTPTKPETPVKTTTQSIPVQSPPSSIVSNTSIDSQSL